MLEQVRNRYCLCSYKGNNTCCCCRIAPAAEQVYGYSKSEEFLGEFMKAGLSDTQPIIATSTSPPPKKNNPVSIIFSEKFGPLSAAAAAAAALHLQSVKQVYGYGKSVEFLGEFMKAGLSDAQPIIATKFAPLKRHSPLLLLLPSHCICCYRS
jgi:hypothetical protein